MNLVYLCEMWQIMRNVNAMKILGSMFFSIAKNCAISDIEMLPNVIIKLFTLLLFAWGGGCVNLLNKNTQNCWDSKTHTHNLVSYIYVKFLSL